MVGTVRRGRPVINEGAPDASLTPAAGLVLVGETVEKVDLIGRLDEQIGPIKQRNRGVTGGQLVVSMAESMLVAGDFLCDLDRLRDDVAGAALRAVPATPASTTAAQLARRFGQDQLAGIEAGWAATVAAAMGLLDERVLQQWTGARPTIDLDPTDVQVFGVRKQGIAFNHQGQRCGRPMIATWAQAGVGLAADLLAGNDDPRPSAPELVARAVAALPDGLGRPAVRADAGLFDGSLARACVKAQADFAIAVKRNTAVWRAIRQTPESAWEPAIGMRDAQVAAIDYLPGGWPEGTRAVARRVRIDAQDISHDPRARRRRTIDKAQLKLALDGDVDHVYGYTVIVTNIDDDPVELERWFRHRTQIEERLKDAKLGMALRHLPSGYLTVNTVWMWAAITALNLSVLLQALAATDTEVEIEGRAHAKRLRHQLLCIPGRVVAHARQIFLRLPPGYDHLHDTYRRLRALPAAPT